MLDLAEACKGLRTGVWVGGESVLRVRWPTCQPAAQSLGHVHMTLFSVLSSPLAHLLHCTYWLHCWLLTEQWGLVGRALGLGDRSQSIVVGWAHNYLGPGPLSSWGDHMCPTLLSEWQWW